MTVLKQDTETPRSQILDILAGVYAAGKQFGSWHIGSFVEPDFVATTTANPALSQKRPATGSPRGGWGALLGCASLLLALTGSAAPTQNAFVPGQLLVKPKAQLAETDFAARLRFYHAASRKTLRHGNVRVLQVDESQAEAVMAALRKDPGIEFVERDGLAQAAFVPNDPYASSGQEWHLNQVQAPAAWNLWVGTTNTVVAIIDSGIDAAHPDLAGRVLPGYDFLSSDTDTSDTFGHGTAVAGVVAAAGNNAAGVAGVAFGCSLLPVKVVDNSGFASYSAIADGIRYATDQGARVINISIAGNSPSSTLQDAINYAWSNNVLVVAAAGNNGNDVLQYPAACDHVLAVSATEPNDTLAPFSSYGSFVSLAAPGDSIWTTQIDAANPYGSWRGTSFASPIVAATAALAASANTSLANTDLVALLETTADDIGAGGYDAAFGYGRVNVFRALSMANPSLLTNPPPVVIPPGDSTNPPPPVADAPTNALLVVQTNGFGRVTPNLNGRTLEVGKTIRLHAVPGPGQIFAGWEGVASTSPVLTLTVQSNLTLTAVFVPTPFPIVKGSYAGLAANASGVTPESSGFFRLTVTSMGQFSGRLLNSGRGYGFHGRFDLNGDAVVTIPRRQQSSLTLALHVALTNSDNQLGGFVTDGNWSSALSADRNVFSARLNPAQQAGVHDFVLQPSGSTNNPTATGSSRIGRSGMASLRGKLRDQHGFAMGSALAANGDCPFYVPFNHGSEVVIGWLNFPSGQEASAAGTVVWAQSGTNGFPAKLLAASAP